MKKITSEELETATREIFKKFPYPKYLGGGLYQVSNNCIVGERAMMKMIKFIQEQIKKEDNMGHRDEIDK